MAPNRLISELIDCTRKFSPDLIVCATVALSSDATLARRRLRPKKLYVNPLSEMNSLLSSIHFLSLGNAAK